MTDDPRDDPRHVRDDLGAYVLGALEPDERRHVEAHVAHCADCRGELALLSGMPALLDRLTPDEAMADLASVPAAIAPALVAGVDDAARRLTRSVQRWRVTAVAASLLAAVATGWQVLPTGTGQDDPPRVVLQPVAADATGVEGTVATHGWDWGTTVEIRVSNLPTRSRYEIWVVDRDGGRQAAGTWGPTDDGSAYVRSATALHRDLVATVEILDQTGAVVLGASVQP